MIIDFEGKRADRRERAQCVLSELSYFSVNFVSFVILEAHALIVMAEPSAFCAERVALLSHFHSALQLSTELLLSDIG